MNDSITALNSSGCSLNAEWPALLKTCILEFSTFGSTKLRQSIPIGSHTAEGSLSPQITKVGVVNRPALIHACVSFLLLAKSSIKICLNSTNLDAAS